MPANSWRKGHPGYKEQRAGWTMPFVYQVRSTPKKSSEPSAPEAVQRQPPAAPEKHAPEQGHPVEPSKGTPKGTLDGEPGPERWLKERTPRPTTSRKSTSSEQKPQSPRRTTRRPRLGDYQGQEVLALVNQPDIYRQLSNEDLDELVFLALFANGGVCGGAADFLVALCREWQTRAPQRARLFLEAALREKIHAGATGAHALLPLILADSDASVVATATIDWCSLCETDAGELTGAHAAVQLFESGLASNRAAIFLGLFSLGDRRVMAALARLRPLLIRQEVKLICASEQRILHGPVVEFLVEWLRELPAHGESGPFGAIAGFLLRLALEHDSDGVVELQRIFPARPGHPSTVTRGRWSVVEFGQQIACQLVAIAQGEGEPKLMPLVMQAWGVGC